MKKAIFTLMMMSFVFALQAQDFIYLRDGGRVQAKVQSVDKKNVMYRNFNDSSSPLYSLKKSQIMMIAYEKGNVQLFKKESAIIQHYLFKKNFVSYHLADLIINDFTLSYEHLFKNGTIGVQIPLSFGYNHYEGFNGFSNRFYTGIYLNFYPTGQGKWRYFMGPGVRVGKGEHRGGSWDHNLGQYVSNNKYNLFYGKLLVNNGVMFTPIASLSLSAVLQLGIRYMSGLASDETVVTTAAFSFNMSYRF